MATLYMRDEYKMEIPDLPSFVCGFEPTTTKNIIFRSDALDAPVTVAFRISKMNAQNQQEFITDYIPFSKRTVDGAGMETVTFTLPSDIKFKNERIRVSPFVDFGQGFWAYAAGFEWISAPLKGKLKKGTWTLYAYTERLTYGMHTHSNVYFGNSVFSTRIDNFDFQKSNCFL